jgi:hypothetical protein
MLKPIGGGLSTVPQRVATHDPDGLDYTWLLQVTFVLTIIGGAPVIAILAVGRDLSTWSARATFAIRYGAVIWLLTGLAVYAYARYRQ